MRVFLFSVYPDERLGVPVNNAFCYSRAFERSIEGRFTPRMRGACLGVLRYLAIFANHSPGDCCGVRIDRGEIVVSARAIEEHTGLSAKTIRNALDRLEKACYIRKKGANQGASQPNVYVVVCYDDIDGFSENGQAKGQEKGKQGATEKEEERRINKDGEVPREEGFDPEGPIATAPTPPPGWAAGYVDSWDTLFPATKNRLVSRIEDEAAVMRAVEMEGKSLGDLERLRDWLKESGRIAAYQRPGRWFKFTGSGQRVIDQIDLEMEAWEARNRRKPAQGGPGSTNGGSRDHRQEARDFLAREAAGLPTGGRDYRQEARDFLAKEAAKAAEKGGVA